MFHKQTEAIDNVHELHDSLYSPVVDVTDIYFPNEECAWVVWEFKEEVTVLVSNSSKNLNLTTGAYTTAHARAMLFNELNKLQTRVLYCDTDYLCQR